MGVALLPFIDEKRLLEAVRPLEKTLSEQEKSQVCMRVYAFMYVRVCLRLRVCVCVLHSITKYVAIAGQTTFHVVSHASLECRCDGRHSQLYTCMHACMHACMRAHTQIHVKQCLNIRNLNPEVLQIYINMSRGLTELAGMRSPVHRI